MHARHSGRSLQPSTEMTYLKILIDMTSQITCYRPRHTLLPLTWALCRCLFPVLQDPSQIFTPSILLILTTLPSLETTVQAPIYPSPTRGSVLLQNTASMPPDGCHQEPHPLNYGQVHLSLTDSIVLCLSYLCFLHSAIFLSVFFFFF